MLKLHSKIFNIIGSSSIVGVTAGGGAVAYNKYVKEEQDSSNDVVATPEDSENLDSYFDTELDSIYSQIEMTTEGPIISDNMIAGTITKIISESALMNTEGISLGYRRLNPKELLLTFKWPQDDGDYRKSYKIKIVQDVI